MRKSTIVAAAAGGVLFLLIYGLVARLGPEATPAPETASRPATERSAEPGTPPAAALAAELAPALPVEDVGRSIAATATPAESAPADRVRLLGRLVDPAGAPVVAADVQITGHEGVWEGRADVPIVEERWKLRGLKTASDADGRFAFDAPPPGGAVWLRVLPTDHHDLFMTTFGGDRHGDRPELAAGTTDLGALTLLVTGEVSGFVRDESANPIANAEVRLDGRFPGGYGRSARTDANGHYVVRSIPPGTYGVEALCRGWLSGEQPNVAVVERRETAGIDFVLHRAPTIRGRVVDDAGQPLAKIRINAWPNGSGQGAFERTKADGTFTLFLPQDEPYRIDVEEEGFRPLRGTSSGDLYRPGAEGVEIVLQRIGATILAVVDAASGAPIEEFVVQVAEGGVDALGGGRGEPAAKHAGGTQSLHAEPEKHALGVRAPGYAPWSGPVAHDDASGRQTVRLERGAVVRGRVLDGGTPVSRCDVRVTGAPVKIDASKPDEEGEERYFSRNYHLDMSAFAAAGGAVKTADDGTFRIDGLAPGTYDLVTAAAGRAPLVRVAVRVEAKQELDLDDLALPAGGCIAGRVLPEPGGKAGGVRVELAWQDPERATTTDDEGRFAFERVAPGEHELRVGPEHANEDRRDPVSVKVEEGKTVEVTIDLAASRPCHLRVLVRVQGKPRAGVQVDVCDPGDGHQLRQAGNTSADGVLEADVPPCGRARLVFSPTFMLGLGQAETIFDFAPGGRVETEVDLPAGSVELVFPAGFALPKLGHGSVRFEYAAMTEDRSHFLRWPHLQFQIASGAALARMSRGAWSGSRWEVEPLAPGECKVSVQLSEYDDPNQQGKARWTYYAGTVAVIAGAKAECSLVKTER